MVADKRRWFRNEGGCAGEEPLVTVVTVNFNHRQGLLATIASVRSQTYRNLEYLIIDGGSTDGSREVIEACREDLAYWESTRDRGIYDAMNKALEHARGEYVLYLNAGDLFAAATALAEIMGKVDGDYDLIYGNHVVVYDGGRERFVPAGAPEELWKGMICSHQGVLVKRALLLEHSFNIANRIGADFELLFSLYCAGATFRRIDGTVAKVEAGGFSDVNRFASIVSRWRVVRAQRKSLRADGYYLFLLADMALRTVVKALLPAALVKKFQGCPARDC